ncbi:hypothetical protein, partial [Mycolicibacterium lacusdiani]|uniref:hypothetical protein n=1 Tax=Mycolicibacterium lacusdiani TaxID=2895283 RepID=UPI001F1BE53B
SALATSVMNTVGPNIAEAPWMKTYASEQFGISASALSSITKALDPDTTSWMKTLGPDTSYGAGMSALATSVMNTVGPNIAEAPWMKTYASEQFGISASALSSITKALDPSVMDTYGSSMSGLIDALSPKPGGDRIGAPWIKELGGGGTYGSGLNALSDAVSPTSLVETIPPSPETVPGLSVSTQAVETESFETVCDGSDLAELEDEYLQWSCDAHGFAAMAIVLTIIPVVLLFHFHGLDWALSIPTVVASLFMSLVLNSRS